jgi:MFS family permease
MHGDADSTAGSSTSSDAYPLGAHQSIDQSRGVQSNAPTLPHQQVKTADKPPATAQAGGWRYTFSSLEVRDFRFLWLGLLSMMGGMQMKMIARGYLVYDITDSPLILGLVNAGSAIPMLTLSLFGGAIADRLDRKRVIQTCQCLVGLLALLIGIAITTGSITWLHLLAAGMIEGALFSFMMPARQAIIPQLVGKDQLNNAMALNASGMSIATLAAPALAGVLYALLGPEGVYYIVAGMAFTALALTGMIPKLGGGPVKTDAPMMRDIKAGLSYIWKRQLVLVLLAMALATTLLAMPFRFLMPVFVVDIYHRGPESLGLLVSIMGVGSLAGSLVVASLRKARRGLLLIGGSFASGIALLLIALFPFYGLAAGIMLLYGLGDAGRRTLNQSLIMEEVEDQYRGRVMSVFMMNFGLMPLGVLPAGIAAEFLGGQAAIGILAGLLLLTTTAILVTQKRLREMP